MTERVACAADDRDDLNRRPAAGPAAGAGESPPPRDPTRFVLIEPSHPGNVGATARAMKVMGFSDLVLVAPRRPGVSSHPEARAMASGATDVLAAARSVASLVEALDGISYVCATAMTPRDFGPPTFAPRALFETLAGSPHTVAFVFGSERFGMKNDDVYRCHACLSIPTPPDYGSLNLAQAVQLVAYDWRCAIGGFTGPRRPSAAGAALADAPAVQGLVDHWREVLVEIDYLDPSVPRKLVPRLLQLAHRVGLSVDELNILRGVARAVLRAAVPKGQRR